MASLLAASAALPAAAPSAGAMLSIAVVAGIFIAIQVRRSLPVEILFLAGLVVVTLAGVISPAAALSGFASGPVLLIGALFAAAAGLRTTGALDWVGAKLLGTATSEGQALRRLALVAPVSAFVLNTPLVAMLAPVVIDWCRARNISPSRMLLPLSYVVILGGVGTVLGTSTTLVCNAQIAEEARSAQSNPNFSPEFVAQVREIGLFEIGALGTPLAVIGVCYLVWVAPRLLPDRTDLLRDFGRRRREYLVEMLVRPDCTLVGKSVEQAGLRRLPGLFLIEINRADEILTPVRPEDVLQEDDRMVFAGVVETIADLQRVPGLVPAVDSTYEHHPAQMTQRRLAEAVLSRSSPLIGRTVREADFRRRYDAAIVAVHRNGERLTNKIGDIRLEPGDTLLLQARSSFVEAQRNNRDFYLVSEVGGSSARRHDRALLAGGLFLALVVWLTASALWGAVRGAGAEPAAWLSGSIKPIAAAAIVVAMVGTRCLTASQARQAIDLQVLVTVASAMGLGAALGKSGAAGWLATNLVGSVRDAHLPASWEPVALLAIVYLSSMLLTECITNAAVATTMMPLAIEVAAAAGCNPRPFLLAVAVAASLSFATPIGYQTNLMVMGPGGYQPRDYLRVGGPLALAIAAAAIALLTVFWRLELAPPP